MQDDSLSTFISLKEAAHLADREVDTVRKWITRGLLSATRKRPDSKRSAYLIRKADLLAYIGENLDPKEVVDEFVEDSNKGLVMTSSSNSELAVLRQSLVHKDEVLGYERRFVSSLTEELARERRNHDSARTELQAARGTIRILEQSSERLQELEGMVDTLKVYERLYTERLGMSWLGRALTPPKQLKPSTP